MKPKKQPKTHIQIIDFSPVKAVIVQKDSGIRTALEVRKIPTPHCRNISELATSFKPRALSSFGTPEIDNVQIHAVSE